MVQSWRQGRLMMVLTMVPWLVLVEKVVVPAVTLVRQKATKACR